MSKLTELRQLKIKANPSDPSYEKLEIVLQAFEGLRIELIKSLKSNKFHLVKDLIIKAAELSAKQPAKKAHYDGTVEDTGVEVARQKAQDAMKRIDDEATKEADDIIENMLSSQSNIRRLKEVGVITDINISERQNIDGSTD